MTAGRLPPDLPCVLFALRRESWFFRRNGPPLRRLPSAPGAASLGGTPPFLLIETGVGAAAVERSLHWLFDHVPRPAFVVFAGFAGGLRSSLNVADVMVASEVHDADGRRWRTTWPGTVPSFVHRGRLLTANRLIATPDEKRQLAARYGADAVDMESAHFAACCAAQGVPFGCVRAISDPAEAPLSPALEAMLAGGRVSPWAVLTATARRPSLLGDLWRLGRDTRRASRRLGRALTVLASIQQGVKMDDLERIHGDSGNRGDRDITGLRGDADWRAAQK